MPILRLYPLILTLSSLLACSHSALVQAAVPEDISPVVSAILADVDAPAMGAVVTSSQAVLAVGVDGVRKQGEDAPVVASDAFHIGSVAKSMTATLAGILVESGDLQWDTRVADLFPDAVASGRPDYRAITLAQLLAHESGLRQLTSDEETGFIWGHRLIDGQRVVMHPDGDYQLPEALAPAGDVHASLPDMAAYAATYLRAWREEDALLMGGTVRRMYKRRLNSALGWGVQALMGHDPVAAYAGSGDLLDWNYMSHAEKAICHRFSGLSKRTFSGLNNSGPQPFGIQ